MPLPVLEGDPTNSLPKGAVSDPVRKVLLAAAALAGACLVALSAGDAGAAGASDRAARAKGVGAPIAWGVCDPPGEDLQCARIRVPLDWDRPNGRTIRLALIRHLASKPEQRMGTMFINPGGPGDTGVGLVPRRPRRGRRFGAGRFDVVSWDPRGTNASTPVQCFTQPAERGEVLGGRRDPHHEGGLRALSAQDRRLGAGAAARSGAGCCRTSRPPTPPATSITCAGCRRGQAHVRRALLRHLPRPDLRQHVPRPGPGDDARRHRRSGRVLKGAEARWPATSTVRRGLRPVPRRSATKPGRSAARSPAAATPRPSASSGCSRGLRRAPIPAPGARPPLWSPQELELRRSAALPVRPDQGTQDVAEQRRESRRRTGGRRIGTRERRDSRGTAAGWAGPTTSAAISCADAPAHRRLRAWPSVIGRFDRVSRLQGALKGWWRWAPCATWPVRGEDSYRGPGAPRPRTRSC